MRVIHSAGEVAIDDTDVVDQTDFLQGSQDSIDADDIYLSTCIDDLLMDGIGAERLVGVAERSDYLNTRHRDSVPGGSQLS